MKYCDKCWEFGYPDNMYKCPKCKSTLYKCVENNPNATPQTVNVPKCPYCNSTNIREISGLERGASILTLGIFSSKINKTHECNNCHSKW